MNIIIDSILDSSTINRSLVDKLNSEDEFHVLDFSRSYIEKYSPVSQVEVISNTIFHRLMKSDKKNFIANGFIYSSLDSSKASSRGSFVRFLEQKYLELLLAPVGTIVLNIGGSSNPICSSILEVIDYNESTFIIDVNKKLSELKDMIEKDPIYKMMKLFNGFGSFLGVLGQKPMNAISVNGRDGQPISFTEFSNSLIEFKDKNPNVDLKALLDANKLSFTRAKHPIELMLSKM